MKKTKKNILTKNSPFSPDYPLTAWQVAYKDVDGNIIQKKPDCCIFERSQFRPYLLQWRQVRYRILYGGQLFSLDNGLGGMPQKHWQIAWNQKLITKKCKGDWRNGNQEQEYKTYPISNYCTDAVVLNIHISEYQKRAWVNFSSWDDDIAFCVDKKITEQNEQQVNKDIKQFRNFVDRNKRLEDFQNLALKYLQTRGWRQY